ncbi:MAG: hypothetical protein M0Z89_04645 [Nitrospiraceae bacterium]|nr:hypothetical protein [Nitrospiraceae bacterium]
MNTFDFSGLNPVVAEKMSPMVEDLIKAHKSNIHSFHIVGSAVIQDYNEKLSDINSLVLLHDMDLQFIAFLAPLGKKYGKKRIAAPLVMTPGYITHSLDSFPVEFLDFKHIHKTVYGKDILQDIQIVKPNLRLQCEREIKTKLIHVRQGYISSLGKRDQLATVLVRSITGSMALFRAIITLLGKEPPIQRTDVVKTLVHAAKLETDIFDLLLSLKAGLIRPAEQELHVLFERYYHALEATGKIIDDLHI